MITRTLRTVPKIKELNLNDASNIEVEAVIISI